ncbi:MAG: arsenate reductase ArsC [Deltaproteobacteria bacterium]|nr:arsenate reductase ArsC [Deltaproteobacteria bacterium]
MDKIRVLFICTHNSGRSQMAEAFMNALAGDRFHAESAGLEPKPIQPLVIQAMKEVGIDISRSQSKSAFRFFKEGRTYSYVITVCENEVEDKCPTFPGIQRRIFSGFDDPSKFEGTDEEKLEKIRRVRDQIKARVEEWIGNLR